MPPIRQILRRVGRVIRIGLRTALLLVLLTPLLAYSSQPPGDFLASVRRFTRPFEFDFVGWTLDALGVKVGQAAFAMGDYLSDAERRQVALDYLRLISLISQTETQINDIYADPHIADPQSAAAVLRVQWQALQTRRALLEPLAEDILQDQVSAVVADLGLSLGGQAIPPVLYHTTPPPDALIVSPRETIRQDADISIAPGLTVEQHIALETTVDHHLDVSSLVVGVGGIGLYPTMVMQTSDINWLAEVIAHEWVHNYLTLRPLGMNYMTSPELRTINETVASIAGKEIGYAVIARYYPDLLPPPPAPSPPANGQPAPPPAFDFRAEMHTTRLTVDDLLAQGKIEEAEAYMEARRRVFWDNGYHIRKLNQAYFAFYGAYADTPGGAAGEDPVGAAVRAFRAQSPSLAQFLQRIARISSFEELQRAVQNYPQTLIWPETLPTPDAFNHSSQFSLTARDIPLLPRWFSVVR